MRRDAMRCVHTHPLVTIHHTLHNYKRTIYLREATSNDKEDIHVRAEQKKAFLY